MFGSLLVVGLGREDRARATILYTRVQICQEARAGHRRRDCETPGGLVASAVLEGWAIRYLKTFLIAVATWLVLSGHYDVAHVSMGVIASALVSYFSTDLLFPAAGDGRVMVLVRWTLYLPYLIGQIVKSATSVLIIVLHPRMLSRIDPRVVIFDTALDRDLARMNLGNSITLTPGTMTIGIEGRTFHVHALNAELAEGMPGEMQDRIARVFGEGQEAGHA